MPFLTEQQYSENDVRRLPDCTQENYLKALDLAAKIQKRDLFRYVCEFVRNATSVEDIINFFEEVLDTREKVALIVIIPCDRPAYIN